MLLKDKVVFITGASRGIGQAAAVLFAEHGAKLVLHAREEASLRETAERVEEVSSSHPTLLAYDVKDVKSIQAAFKAIKKEYGCLDAVINNAGMMQESMLGMIRQDMIEETMQTNLQAVLYHMQFASRLMTKQKSGSIINVSSIVGVNGSAGNAAYAASKAGVIGATKSASKELAPLNIRVNAVAPGFIETDLIKHYQDEKFNQTFDQIKMKRVGQPEEVANVFLFLASNLSSYVTGQVIGVDGGMVI